MANGRQKSGPINGINPLQYQGNTPNLVTFNRRPNVSDGASWPIGMQWIIPIDDTFTTGEFWVLVSKDQGINIWKKLHGGGGPTPPTNTLLVNKIFITTPGAGTYTPTTGMVQAYVECVGGGGGTYGKSGLAAVLGGAGAGGYCAKLFTSTEIGASVSYSVGSGGAAGSGGAGGNGDDTTFASILTAGGGVGVTSSSGAPSAGGSAIGGDVNISGQSGTYGFQVTQGVGFANLGGAGGSSVYGEGGPMQYLTGANTLLGNAGTGYGSGASGSVSNGPAVDGVAGQPGIIIITEYLA